MKTHVKRSIDISRELIDKGIPRNPWCCPISLWLKANVKGASDAFSNRHILQYWCEDGTVWEATAPEPARRLMFQFDGGMRAEPVKFMAEFVKQEGKDNG